MSSSIRHGYETREMPEFEPATRQHIDDQGVDKLSEAMKAKLKQKRSDGRRGWQNKSECTAEDLSNMLRAHVEKGDPVDVANFCMMLHYRGERIREGKEK